MRNLFWFCIDAVEFPIAVMLNSDLWTAELKQPWRHGVINKRNQVSARAYSHKLLLLCWFWGFLWILDHETKECVEPRHASIKTRKRRTAVNLAWRKRLLIPSFVWPRSLEKGKGHVSLWRPDAGLGLRPKRFARYTPILTSWPQSLASTALGLPIQAQICIQIVTNPPNGPSEPLCLGIPLLLLLTFSFFILIRIRVMFRLLSSLKILDN